VTLLSAHISISFKGARVITRVRGRVRAPATATALCDDMMHFIRIISYDAFEHYHSTFHHFIS
jgi:hypothetical protein